MITTPKQLKEILTADGWRVEWHGYEWKHMGVEWWAWKTFEGFADCSSNEKPPHIAIFPWEHADRVRPWRSVEFEVTGEVGHDHWVTLKVYSVTMDEAVAVIPRATEILRAAWNAAAALKTPAN